MDLNDYLQSLAADGAMSTEDLTALNGILSKNPKAADKAVKGFMLQSDYTKKTTELSRDRDRLVAESTAMNDQLSKALKDLENNKITANTYRARIERIGDEYGVDVSDILTAPKAEEIKTPQPAAVDPLILARLEAAEKNYRYNPEVSALLLDAQSEYGRIFGTTEGFRAADVLKFARENNLGLMGNPETGQTGAFERLYKVADKKHEKLVASITAEATRKAEETAQQRMDQVLAGKATGESNPNGWAVPGSRILGKDFRDRNNALIDERAPKKLDTVAPGQSRSAAQNEIEGGAAGFAKAFIQRRSQGIGFGQEKVA